MERDILCIDVGSTNVKCALYTQFRRLWVRRADFPQPFRNGNGVFEVRTGEIVSLIKQIVRTSPKGSGVLLSVQMHGHVLSDREEIYVSWRDHRRVRDGRFLRDETEYAHYFRAECGTKCKQNLAPFSLLDDYERGLSVKGELFSLGSYLSYALTGNNVSHETDLAALGFYLRGGRTNGSLLCALPYKIVLPVCERRPRRCGEFEGRTVYTPFGDQQCSVYALNAGNDAVLNVGTASQICRVVSGFSVGEYESRPYFGNATLCTCTGITGGANLANGAGQPLQKEYARAFAAVGARERVVCTGGAFGYYERELTSAVKACGYTPEVVRADALDGLMNIYRNYLWNQKE